IKTIYGSGGMCKGVDASESDKIGKDNLAEVVQMARALSERTGAIIAISGPIDIVASLEKVYLIYNGHPMMERITGTGCMLTTLIGAFCGANPEQLLDATAAAVTAMGLCGELAYDKMIAQEAGTLSFRTYLIDYISRLDTTILQGGMKVEIQ
ncbi:MAG: hydroxyethylthiazole kinase, partial [Cellulosilyticaceae bacterium]